jgi:hypothetical protein
MVTQEADEEVPTGIYSPGGKAYYETIRQTCEVNGVQGTLYLEETNTNVEESVHLSFAIYSSLDSNAIDYASPPTTWITSHRDRSGPTLALLSGRVCDRGGNFPYPPAGHTMRVGVVAVDLAGNRAPPTEVLLPGLSAVDDEVQFIALHEPPGSGDRPFPFGWLLVALLGGVALAAVGWELWD